jgi:hypothetical protein
MPHALRTPAVVVCVTVHHGHFEDTSRNRSHIDQAAHNVSAAIVNVAFQGPADAMWCVESLLLVNRVVRRLYPPSACITDADLAIRYNPYRY